jgi:glycine cleavage system H protein
MPDVRGCHLPDDLLYDVANHIWFREVEDGKVRLGMTSVATALAGEIVAFTPKKVGKEIKEGKSCATIESGKWVGPAKSLVSGEVVEVNESLVAKPNIANSDPYNEGWMVTLAPNNWDSAKSALTPGAQVGPEYDAKMAEDGFEGCG